MGEQGLSRWCQALFKIGHAREETVNLRFIERAHVRF